MVVYAVCNTLKQSLEDAALHNGDSLRCLKMLEALSAFKHVHWQTPSLNQQLYHLNLKIRFYSGFRGKPESLNTPCFSSFFGRQNGGHGPRRS